MNLQDCRRILQVPPGAGLDEVKAAFRKLAFRLHPDMNPSPRAAEQFRELNEAYVLLSHNLKDDAQPGRPGQAPPYGTEQPGDARARKAKAEKAYARSGADPGRQAGAKAKPGGTFHFREEEVLRDLLSDPFARQVFEDIYSQLKHGKPAAQARQTGQKGKAPSAASAPFFSPRQQPADKPLKRRKLEITWGDKSLGLDLSRGIVGGVKSWLRGQLDDEQTVSFPAHALGPGKILRLIVSARFGDPKTVEVTLPPDFVVGRPVRLRGLGRKLGPFIGDLFLRVLAK
jgi:curved DNA-binding protein CbpA